MSYSLYLTLPKVIHSIIHSYVRSMQHYEMVAMCSNAVQHIRVIYHGQFNQLKTTLVPHDHLDDIIRLIGRIVSPDARAFSDPSVRVQFVPNGTGPGVRIHLHESMVRLCVGSTVFHYYTDMFGIGRAYYDTIYDMRQYTVEPSTCERRDAILDIRQKAIDVFRCRSIQDKIMKYRTQMSYADVLKEFDLLDMRLVWINTTYYDYIMTDERYGGRMYMMQQWVIYEFLQLAGYDGFSDFTERAQQLFHDYRTVVLFHDAFYFGAQHCELPQDIRFFTPGQDGNTLLYQVLVDEGTERICYDDEDWHGWLEVRVPPT